MTTDFTTSRQEAFACVAFSDELVVFVAELVPEFVEVFIMGAVNYVGEPDGGVRPCFSKLASSILM